MNEIIKYNKSEYPAISVSDSVVSNIIVDDNTVICAFDNTGFWVKNKENDCYHRTKETTLTLYNCDIENVDIFLLTEMCILGEIRRVKEYLEFDKFVKNINKKVISFEIVQEYKSDRGSLFIGRIRSPKMKSDCYWQIDYERIKFSYSE